LAPQAAAHHQIDSRQIEDREITAVVHVEQDVEVIQPDAKRRDARIEHMQPAAAPAGEYQKQQTK
jgi:hypothetical protein